MNTTRNMNRELDIFGGKIKNGGIQMGKDRWTKVDEKKIGSDLVITEEFTPMGQPTVIFRDIILEITAIGGYGAVRDIKYVTIERKSGTY